MGLKMVVKIVKFGQCANILGKNVGLYSWLNFGKGFQLKFSRDYALVS